MSYTIGASATNNVSSSSTVLSLKAGDYFDIRPSTSNGSYAAGGGTGSTIATSNFLTVERLSGPSVIAATDTVVASYYGCTSALSGTLATMTYANKYFDSHNSYSGGIYTLPVSGKYEINAAIFTNATYSASNAAVISIFNGATEITRSYLVMQPFSGSGSSTQYVTVNNLISGNAGDQITIKASSGGTSPTVTNAVPISNYFSIARVGN
jgi:hypothetical protein